MMFIVGDSGAEGTPVAEKSVSPSFAESKLFSMGMVYDVENDLDATSNAVSGCVINPIKHVDND